MYETSEWRTRKIFFLCVSSKISARSQPISGVRLKYVSLTGNNDQGKMRSQSHLAKLNLKRIVSKVSSYLGDNCVKGGREGMNQNTEQEVALLQLQFASQKRLGKRERCSHEMRGWWHVRRRRKHPVEEKPNADVPAYCDTLGTTTTYSKT